MHPSLAMEAVQNTLKLTHHFHADLASYDLSPIPAVEILNCQSIRGEPLKLLRKSCNACEGGIGAKFTTDHDAADEVSLPVTFSAEILYEKSPIEMCGNKYVRLAESTPYDDFFDVGDRLVICQLQEYALPFFVDFIILEAEEKRVKNFIGRIRHDEGQGR